MNIICSNDKNIKSNNCINNIVLNLGYNFICFGIIGYISILLFNGVIMHYGLQFQSLETIRPILPEIFLTISLIGWCFCSGKLSHKALCIIIYFILTLFLSLSNFSIESLLITFRNFLIPFIFMLILMNCKCNINIYKKMGKRLFIVFALFSIIGCIFSVIQQSQGWSAMGIYFQGYQSWAEEGKVRIVMSNYGTLRCLGTTGDSATFGLYNTIAIALFLFSSKKTSLIKYILTVLSMISIYESGNKTALLIALFLVFYYLISKFFYKNKKLINQIIFILIFLLSILILLFSVTADSESFFYTMNIRYQLWGTIFTSNNISNLFIPHMVYDYSSFGNSGGVTTIWDNSYLFLAFSFGIIGFILFFLSLIKIVRNLWKSNFIKMLTFIFLFSMFSTNIFVGRNIAGFLMIFLGFLYMSRKELLNEE